jgi:hypothetical protein
MLMPVGIGESVFAQGANETPTAELNNSVLKVLLYLPDAKKGYYRGTRFDWSGVIGGLEYKGHQYYGPWFTKTDPKVIDFIYDGDDIVAGPCSAITGPVDEFSTDDKALGYDEASRGARSSRSASAFCASRRREAHITAFASTTLSIRARGTCGPRAPRSPSRTNSPIRRRVTATVTIKPLHSPRDSRKW